jgi:hypothetical protein
MDTNLGFIELTDKQITNFDSLKTENIKGFSYWSDSKEVVVVSDTEVDVNALKVSVAALPDTYSQEYYRGQFDLVMFQTDLASLLPTLSDINLRWEFAALNTYATNKDFEGMAGYMDMLVSGEVALQSDDDAVIALLTKQGIVI